METLKTIKTLISTTGGHHSETFNVSRVVDYGSVRVRLVNFITVVIVIHTSDMNNNERSMTMNLLVTMVTTKV